MVRIVKSAPERKEEIIKAGCELFLSKGYENTTMQDVMAKVQIAKGTIYHYFKSKEELLAAVISFIVNKDIERQKHLAAQVSGNALEKMHRLVMNGRNNDEAEILNNLHHPANAGMHIRLIAELITRLAPLYAEVIKQGCDEGFFTTQSPLECAEFLLAASQFLTDIGVYPWTQEQLQRRTTALPGLIEAQLEAPRGSFAFLLENAV
ncbi:MAG: TetR/AcrR family transcriptional regulator [Desulforhopalus sp.]